MSVRINVKNKGGIAELRKLLEDAPDVRKDVSIVINEAALDLVRECFDKERDPYGKKWAPITHREGKILQDNRILANSFARVQANSKRSTIGTSIKYAEAHQNPGRKTEGGGLKRPRRMMVPDESKGLPKKWEREFIDVADEVLEKKLGRRLR